MPRKKATDRTTKQKNIGPVRSPSIVAGINAQIKGWKYQANIPATNRTKMA